MGSLWHGVRQTGIQWKHLRSLSLIILPSKWIYPQLSHWTNEKRVMCLLQGLAYIEYLNSSCLFCFRSTLKGESGARSLGSLSLSLSQLFRMCLWYSCGCMYMFTSVVTLCVQVHTHVCTCMSVEAGSWHSHWLFITACSLDEPGFCWFRLV